MQFNHILCRCKDGILYITLNRPQAHNALTPIMWKELGIALQQAHNEEVRVILLTGAGDKAFASGAEIKELSERNYLNVLAGTAGGVLTQLENLEKPSICAIDGYALGGGCELAMACDLRIATKKSCFGQPELGLGILPRAGGTQRLVHFVGLAKAKELIFTGRLVNAEEAQMLGLVNKVVENDRTVLFAAAEEMAQQIIQKAPLAVALAKLSVNAAMETNLQTGLLVERLAETIAFSTEDRREGTAAFLEKRKPCFAGK